MTLFTYLHSTGESQVNKKPWNKTHNYYFDARKQHFATLPQIKKNYIFVQEKKGQWINSSWTLKFVDSVPQSSLPGSVPQHILFLQLLSPDCGDNTFPYSPQQHPVSPSLCLHTVYVPVNRALNMFWLKNFCTSWVV